jgi:hypothetical protein
MLLTLRIYWVIHKVLYLGGDIFLKKRWGENFIIQFGFYITWRNFSTFLLNDKKKRRSFEMHTFKYFITCLLLHMHQCFLSS